MNSRFVKHFACIIVNVVKLTGTLACKSIWWLEVRWESPDPCWPEHNSTSERPFSPKGVPKSSLKKMHSYLLSSFWMKILYEKNQSDKNWNSSFKIIISLSTSRYDILLNRTIFRRYSIKVGMFWDKGYHSCFKVKPCMSNVVPAYGGIHIWCLFWG